MKDSLETTSQSFIVKVWVEDNAKETDVGVWHGHITHVPSGKRHYLKNLDEIHDFIAPHLEGMGVKLERHWRMNLWLKHLFGKG